MKILLAVIIILVFFTLFVTSQAYAPCMEGPRINCNNYLPQTLSQIYSDKLNYETHDKPVITIVGVPSAATHLEIDDLSSNIMFEHDLNLSSNGTAQYILDISYYKSGEYSATATSLMSKVTTSFTVGMTPPGGRMVLSIDKNSYLPGDRVSILGAGNSNTLIQLSLIDPYGTSIRSTKIFSDKTGHFSSSNFTIPNNAISGIWQIGATGGVMHVHVQIVVNSTLDNYSGIKTDKTIIPSPLKQFKSGIGALDVTCKTGLQLVIKSEDLSPTCVTHDTSNILVKRGWTHDNTILPKNMQHIVIPPLNDTSSEKPEATSENKNSSPLQLFLSIDSEYENPAEPISIDVGLDNTGSVPLTLAKSDNWQRNDMGSGLCSHLPFGISILKGYYTEQNMSSAKSLVIYDNVPCPLPTVIKSYTFEPLSSEATQECNSLFSCPGLTDMKAHLVIPDFMYNSQHHSFDVGKYTIVGGDEWGHVVIRHFTEAYATAYSNPLGK